MARKRKVVIEIPTLERDDRTGALLNRSKTSHMQHRKRKLSIIARNDEVVLLRDEVNSLRAELKSFMNKSKLSKSHLLLEE